MCEALRHLWQTVSRLKTTSVQGDSIHYRKCVSLVDLTSLGMASVVGTGIHVILGHIASEQAGPSVVLSMLMASVTGLLSGLCYSELAERFSGGGSCYTYAYVTLGEIWAFLIGWNMMLELVIGSAVASKALIYYADAMFNGTLRSLVGSARIRDVTSEQPEYDFDILAAILLLSLTFVTLLYVKVLCVINNIFLVVGLLVVGATVMVGIVNMDSENWTRGAGFFPKGLSGILSAASTGTFTFVGYDLMAGIARETPSHAKTLSSANTCVFLVGLLVTFTASVAVTSVVPYPLLGGRAPLMDAFRGRHLDGMRPLVLAGATAGLLASAYAAHFAVARVVQAMAADGLLFPALSRVGPSRGTPWVAAILSGTLAAVLALFFDLRYLVRCLGAGTLLSGAVAPVAALVTRYNFRFAAGPNGPLESAPSIDSLGNHVDYAEIDQQPPIEETTELIDLRNETGQLQSCSTRGRGAASGEETMAAPSAVVGGFYGSFSRRQMSVEFINESFYSAVLETAAGKLPSRQSWRTVRRLLAVFVGAILVFGVYLLYGWGWSETRRNASYFWRELILCLGGPVAMLLLGALVCRQPRHHIQTLRNKMPCVPFLPLVSLAAHLLLLVFLPFSAWVRLLVWSFMDFY